MPILDVQYLACRRGGRILFAGLDFSLSKGEAALALGHNGAGKSSLLRVLAGLIPPFTGRILWNDEDTRQEPYDFRAALRYVGHADGLQTNLTVIQNLRYWAALYSAPTERLALTDALAAVGLDDLADLPARMLSAGQRRRLALARPIATPSTNAHTAGLWLLDEPTVALDRPSIARIESAIAEFRERGGIVIASTNAPLTLPGAQEIDVSATVLDLEDAFEDAYA
jgi:heme exporter protein A